MTIHRGRVRWHCRRALLELDLVLARFLETQFDQLDESQLEILQELLNLEDHELWPMVNGSKECPETRWEPIIGMLRHSKASGGSGIKQ
ncbi:succinate dehydrogenase assembly factor 2 [Nitrogeniibacter mangrovi]|uniref:FAD assembly factor SdhE n=1 Tax=Nitrogeniibacter mangrovi TaxID=2016596 RepID=A0A6C1B273_9RHOO|nr:succinate dehydrogenase assembly factor 2 [Nitrogeniibacter mangrovi]QID17736.1 succinate dehydrogenase assembly factor 2 [Nitrogeniibacter mangrovi]